MLVAAPFQELYAIFPKPVGGDCPNAQVAADNDGDDADADADADATTVTDDAGLKLGSD